MRDGLIRDDGPAERYSATEALADWAAEPDAQAKAETDAGAVP